MAARVLVGFHTVEGQAGKIASRIASVLEGARVAVDLVEVERAPSPDGYDAVVLGDSIHVVHHSRQLVHYLRAHVDRLNAMPSALFQVSMTSANPDEEHAATAAELVKELRTKTGFDPDLVGIFAGALAYTKYGWIKRRVMRSIARKEAAPDQVAAALDTAHDHEYTDWDAVEQLARDVAALV